jgi:hypothetical protein
MSELRNDAMRSLEYAQYLLEYYDTIPAERHQRPMEREEWDAVMYDDEVDE